MVGATKVLMIGALLFFPVSTYAMHGQEPSWINDMTDKRGIKCCTQRDCMPVQSVDVLRKTPDGMLEIVIDRWVGAVYEHTILQAPKEVLHHWLCMNEGATMGEAFDWCYDREGNPRLTPACVRCVITSLRLPPS